MLNLNYFELLSFFWATIGIGSRILMAIFGQTWNKWETEKAYSKDKPAWIYVVGIAGILIVFYTWFQVFTTSIPNSWILALLITLTLVKISKLLFNYEEFRSFVAKTLNDKKKMTQLNIAVIILSVILILMGIYLY